MKTRRGIDLALADRAWLLEAFQHHIPAQGACLYWVERGDYRPATPRLQRAWLRAHWFYCNADGAVNRLYRKFMARKL